MINHPNNVTAHPQVMNFSRQSWEEYKILYPARYVSRNIQAQFQLQINNYNYAKLLERDEERF